jgi:putative mRNA 3-end processing factor
MGIHELLEKASVTIEGSILLGKHVVCDTFQKGRPLAVFTHIHSDHMIGFASALGVFGTGVLVSVPTRDLLVALEGRHLLRRTNFVALNWGSKYTCSEDNVTLYPTQHILGSSQVLVEDRDGNRLVYTGDFGSNTQPIESDVLVLDVTYGILRRNYEMHDALEELIYLVRRQLQKQEPVYLFTTRGRIQRLMRVLRKEGINAPFISTPEEVRLAQVYENYQGKIGNYFSDNSMEAWELLRKEDPYVAFYTLGSQVPLADKYLKIRITAYGALYPVYMTGKKSYVVALSDHVDFEGTLEYIRGSKPKLVITDGSRSEENAILVAESLKKELKVEARALPEIRNR